MTELTMLDVGHGQCIVLKATNGSLMVFDCGWSQAATDRPYTLLKSIALEGAERIEMLVVTNYDQDHIDDLPAIERLGIRLLTRNKSVSPEALARMKSEGGAVTDEMQALIEMMSTYNSAPTAPPAFDSFDYVSFHAAYPDDFEDTNNLSLVTVVRSEAGSLLVPGDLEGPGWDVLLARMEFREQLKDVKVVVASHHGRESGYCEELFNLCSPAVVLVSDGPKEFDTQETTDRYAEQATGIQYGGETRRVLTTRCDGRIAIQF